MSRSPGIYRASLTHPGFRWLTLASAVSELGDLLYVVGLAVLVYDRTSSAAWVTAAVVLRMLPLVLLPPLAGSLADRVDRRRLIITTNAVMAVLAAAMAVATSAGAPVAVVVAITVLLNACSTAVGPAVAGLVPAVVPEKDLAAANAVTGAVSSLMSVVGPATGGVLLLLGSPATAFALNAVTFAVAALCVLAVRTSAPLAARAGGPGTAGEDGDDAGGAASARRAAQDGPTSTAGVAKLLVTDRTLRVATASVVAACFALGATSVLFVVVSTQLLGSGASGTGYLLAAAGAGGLLGAPLAGRVAASAAAGRTVVACVAVTGSALVLLPLAPGIVVACLLAALLGCGYLITEVLLSTLLQRTLDGGLLGRATGLVDSAAFAGILLGSLVSGAAVEAVGVHWALVVVGAIPLLAAAAGSPTAVGLDRAAAAKVAALAPRTALLARSDALAGAGAAALERLAAAAVEVDVAAGTTVVTEGDAPDDVFVVVSGELVVTTTTGASSSSSSAPGVPHLGPADCFGEIGLLRGRPRTATVTASAPSTLLRLPGQLFLDVVRSDDLLAQAVGMLATTRLRRTHTAAVG